MKSILIFLTGAGIGAGTCWYFTKRYYSKMADEEIKDVVNKFKNREKEKKMKEKEEVLFNNVSPRGNNISKDKTAVQPIDNEELSNGIIDNPKGVEQNDEDDDIELKSYEKETIAPYIITEEEFGDNEEYDQKTLFWYYRDNILATDEDLEVEDKFTTIGDALEEFKKDRYLERIYVRNEEDETDYEILISEKHFYEVTREDKE